MKKQVSELRSIAAFFFGCDNVAVLARAMDTNPGVVRGWYRDGGPANLPGRIGRLLGGIALKHVGLALKAAEWQIKVSGGPQGCLSHQTSPRRQARSPREAEEDGCKGTCGKDRYSGRRRHS